MSTKRRNEMWISNNRVLVGGIRKVTARNSNFGTEETQLLISLWGDPQVQKTLITTHKKHTVIAKLADKMREYGYHRSPEEINTRIKNLKCFYNRIKKDLETGASSDEPSWKHFAAMDEIMTRRIFSVRPDEIPKPSLRYRLEEEKREREEKELEQQKKQKQKKKYKSIFTDESTDNDSDDDSDDDFQIDEDDDESDPDDDDDDDNEEDAEANNDNENTNDDVDVEKLNNESVPSMPDSDENKADIQQQLEKNKEDKLEKGKSDEAISPLLVPKEEPIDIDDSDDDDNNATKTRTTTLVNESGNKTITSNNSAINQAFINSSQNIATVIAAAPNQQTQSGKISLVPTNFLLKPQVTTQSHQQIKFHTTRPQHRIIFPKPATGATGTIQGTPTFVQSAMPTVGPAGSSQVPMKVLLVNALPPNKPVASTSSTVAVAPSAITSQISQVAHPLSNQRSITTVLQNQHTQQHQIQSQQQISQLQHQLQQKSKLDILWEKQQQQESEKSSQQKSKTPTNSSKAAATNDAHKDQPPIKKIKLSKSSKGNKSIRGLLSRLTHIQSENLEVNKNRLEIEKQRFEFEKSIAEKFLNAFLGQSNSLASNLQNQTIIMTTQNSNSIPSAVTTAAVTPTTVIMNGEIDDTIPLLTPKIEKENDGYSI